MIGEPPVFDGALQPTASAVLLAETLTPSGADGAVLTTGAALKAVVVLEPPGVPSPVGPL